MGEAADVLGGSPVLEVGEELVVGDVEELVHLSSVATSGAALGANTRRKTIDKPCTEIYPYWNTLTWLVIAL